MQGIKEIARQNAASQALHQANQSGENRYVVYADDQPGKLAIVAQDPGPGNAIYVARPDIVNPAA